MSNRSDAIVFARLASHSRNTTSQPVEKGVELASVDHTLFWFWTLGQIGQFWSVCHEKVWSRCVIWDGHRMTRQHQNILLRPHMLWFVNCYEAVHKFGRWLAVSSPTMQTNVPFHDTIVQYINELCGNLSSLILFWSEEPFKPWWLCIFCCALHNMAIM